jgi:type IX secretion system PorP/SprF family membrane protein
MKKILYTLLIVFFAVENCQSQDPHYSQFFASPLSINPAFTGKFNGNYRVIGNYRNQWPELNNAFITTTGSIDFHILQNKITYNDTWGVGLSALSDNSANGAVKFNYLSLSTAYHKGLDEDGNHQLGIGIMATYANMLINTSNLIFEDQLTPRGFTDPTKDFPQNSSLESSYLGVNAGILYNGSTNERNNFYLGVSMYHINRPQQYFTGTSFNLNSRININTGTYFPVGEMLTLHLSGLYSSQGGAYETLLGGALQVLTSKNDENGISIYAGSWLRLNDAFIPYFGLEFSNARLGISYDINTSQLKTSSLAKGGLEISLVYCNQPNTTKNVRCPKF